MLFTRSSLQYLLETTGFQKVEDQPYRPLCRGVFIASSAIASGKEPFKYTRSTLSITKCYFIKAEQKAKKDVIVREVVAVKAWKTK